ncbi:MAG: peptidoglycan editing factor PgeF [Paraprevotella sp.]|nr:peptidoglycan editing factor PgeF [Paraprevotella sp.]
MTPDLLRYEMGEGVVAFSTRRGGGVSEGNYASFNANPYCGDEPENVCKNQELLARFLDIKPSHLVLPHQVHEAKILRVEESFFTYSKDEQARLLEGVDALYTQLPRTCIAVSTADCVPVLLYDRGTNTVAAIHAGWRGTVKRIVEHTLDEMVTVVGTRPSDVYAVVGPSISLASFEVGDEVYEYFAEAGFPMSRLAARFPAMGVENNLEKWHIDLWEANCMQLLDKGLSAEHIHVSEICTYLNDDEFFSARKLGIRSGRILNGIYLK